MIKMFEDEMKKRMFNAESKDWDKLADYDFVGFAKHASKWMTYNEIQPNPVKNPFSEVAELGVKGRLKILNIQISR